MNYVYHGSFYPDIKVLNPVSKLHSDHTQNVVYATSNRAYALFYIWDSKHNKKSTKHVTCAVKNGIVNYYEQFPNQFKSFYDGVRGYLYSAIRDENFLKGTEEDIWISKNKVYIENCEKINNVYNEILKLEKLGSIKIIRFESLSPEEQGKIIDMIAEVIKKKELLTSPLSEEAVFYSSYYVQAWEKAKSKFLDK